MTSLTILPIQWKIYQPGGSAESDELHVWGLREDNSQSCLLRLITYQDSPEFLYEITVGIDMQRKNNLHSMILTCMPRGTDHIIRENALINMYTYNNDQYYVKNIYLRTRRDVNSFLRNWRSKNWREGVIFNEKIDYVRKFLTRLDLQPCQRITVSGATLRDGKFKLSTVEEYSLDIALVRDSISPSSREIPIYPGVMSFDLEVYSENHNAFPDPSKKSNEIFMVSLIYHKFGEELLKLLIVNGDCADIPETHIFRVNSEYELLQMFCQTIAHYNPDILTGYNIFTFDVPYLITRGTKCGFRWPSTLGRLTSEPMKIEGFNITGKRYEKFDMHGRIVFDVLKYVEFFHGKELPQKKLDYVGNYFLGENKHDVSAQEMFRVYAEHLLIKRALKNGLRNTEVNVRDMSAQEAAPFFRPDVAPHVAAETMHRLQNNLREMARVGDYCVQDSVLTSKLFRRLEIWLTIVEFANILTIQPEKLFVTGQQIPSLNQIYDLAYQQGFGIPTVYQKSTSYKGAYVLEPRVGISDNVMCVDFNSMYPSIIRAFNICYSTLIPEEKLESVREEDYNTISFEENGETCKLYFVKSHIRVGILPELSRNLIEQRTAVRRKIAETDDPVTKISLDKRQLALKISANALYGMTGAGDKAMLPMNELARAITGIGRNFLDRASDFLRQTYNAEIIYGDTDSVMFSCPDVTTGQQCMQRGPEAAAAVSKIFPPPLRMEFEKAGRIFCITKKKYVYWKLMADGNFIPRDRPGAYLDTGTAMKRRETPPFIRKIYKRVIDSILDFTPAPQIMEYILRKVHKLLNGQVKLEKLFVTRTVTGTSYKNKNVEMSIYLRYLRDNSMEPEVGEILRYVFVKSSGRYVGDKIRPYERFRDGLIEEELDYSHYLHMLSKKIDDVWRISQNRFIDAVVQARIMEIEKKTDVDTDPATLYGILQYPLERLEKELKKQGRLENCHVYNLLLQL